MICYKCDLCGDEINDKGVSVRELTSRLKSGKYGRVRIQICISLEHDTDYLSTVCRKCGDLAITRAWEKYAKK